MTIPYPNARDLKVARLIVNLDAVDDELLFKTRRLDRTAEVVLRQLRTKGLVERGVGAELDSYSRDVTLTRGRRRRIVDALSAEGVTVDEAVPVRVLSAKTATTTEGHTP